MVAEDEKAVAANTEDGIPNKPFDFLMSKAHVHGDENRVGRVGRTGGHPPRFRRHRRRRERWRQIRVRSGPTSCGMCLRILTVEDTRLIIKPLLAFDFLLKLCQKNVHVKHDG